MMEIIDIKLEHLLLRILNEQFHLQPLVQPRFLLQVTRIIGQRETGGLVVFHVEAEIKHDL